MASAAHRSAFPATVATGTRAALVTVVLACWSRGAAAEGTDWCHVRTGNPDVVPCLRVPPCTEGEAVIPQFYLSVPPVGLLPPKQQTRVAVCWGWEGLLVKTHATDDNIFNNATGCNQAVFSLGDVLEVFLGPVEDPTDDPEWYHELDTGASGALWAAETFNSVNSAFSSHGNVSNCNRTASSPHWCTPGMLNCTGLAHFDHGLTAEVTVNREQGWWENELRIPFAIFRQPFLRRWESPPWRLWRGNFYRYDYPYHSRDHGMNGSHYELTAWSPTHCPSFHTPSRFGVIVLDGDVAPRARG